MKPLVVIPARGGSKRLPGKNIKLLNGKPLIHYTIEAAREEFVDNHICVSTDDESIEQCAESTGLYVPFIRPLNLATDNASSRDVLIHALSYYKENGYEPDTIILLQPTSPFRTSSHINEAMQLFSHDLDMVVSVKKTNSNPYRILYEETSDGLLVKSKSTENSKENSTIPDVWELNGAIYVISSASLIQKPISSFKKIKKYVMPQAASVDIDTELDWALAECILMKNLV